MEMLLYPKSVSLLALLIMIASTCHVSFAKEPICYQCPKGYGGCTSDAEYVPQECADNAGGCDIRTLEDGRIYSRGCSFHEKEKDGTCSGFETHWGQTVKIKSCYCNADLCNGPKVTKNAKVNKTDSASSGLSIYPLSPIAILFPVFSLTIMGILNFL